jgi:hypothetical protein
MMFVEKGSMRKEHQPAQTKLIASRITRVIILAVGVVLGGALAIGSARAAAPLQMVYRISHSVVGDIGSYTCTVEPLANGGTQVQTREHINVRMLGLPLYSMDATDTERWEGNRLISFDAVSDKANGRFEVKGEAQGTRFVITSPQGTLTTAATVHPADPCIGNFPQSTTVLRPDTGDIEDVRVSGGEATSLTMDGTPVPVRKYDLDGKTRYTVWLASRNLPVMFAINDSTGRTTFTLAKCVACGATGCRVGME